MKNKQKERMMGCLWIVVMALVCMSPTSPELDGWVVTPRGGLFLFFLILAIGSFLGDQTGSLEDRVKALEEKE